MSAKLSTSAELSSAKISRRSFSQQLTVSACAGLLAGQHSQAEGESLLPLPDAWEIWDLHCHLASLAGDTPEQRADRLVEVANRMGISRMIFFMGFPWSYDPDPKEIRQQNDQVMRVVDHGQPRLMGFAYLNPKFVAESLAELERCVRDGPLVGIKLWVSRRCHDLEIDPIIETAALFNAPVFQHTWFKAAGNRPGESTPLDLAQLAERHPRASLICGHAGGDWELGIRSVRKHPNVSIELGGFDPTAGVVEMAMRELGPDRILYGSDVAGRSFASQLAKVLGAEISDNAKCQILSGNLKSLLRPILARKGQLE